MASKTISVDLDSTNLLWLRAKSGGRNLSEMLNKILAQARSSDEPDRERGTRERIRSVRGTIRLPESDPHLEQARKTVRERFRQSVERTSRFLAETDETEA